MKDKEAFTMMSFKMGQAIGLMGSVSHELKENALAGTLSYQELQVKMREVSHRLDVFLREFPDAFMDQPEEATDNSDNPGGLQECEVSPR